jgi:hypothetical protein
MAEANHLQGNHAIETFLSRAIDHPLSAATDYLQ